LFFPFLARRLQLSSPSLSFFFLLVEKTLLELLESARSKKIKKKKDGLLTRVVLFHSAVGTRVAPVTAAWCVMPGHTNEIRMRDDKSLSLSFDDT
jgi:hypothetical protein